MTSSLAPCKPEEADTRLFLHAAHASCKIMISSVDTDVVLKIATFQELALSEPWISFGTGNTFTHNHVHEISQCLDPVKCKSLPVFHAITGWIQYHHSEAVGKSLLGILGYSLKSLPYFCQCSLVLLNLTLKS